MPLQGVLLVQEHIGRACILTHTVWLTNKMNYNLQLLPRAISLVLVRHDEFHGWSAETEGYQLFRRDWQGRQCVDIDCTWERLEFTALDVWDDDVENIWRRIKRAGSKADTMGVYYWLPTQDACTPELFHRQLEKRSESVALILMADFDFPDNWKYHSTLTGKFLKHA